MTRTFYAAGSGTQGGSPLAGGDETMPRYGMTTTNVQLTSGRLALTFFTSTGGGVTQVRTAVSNTAGAGLTLARYGLYAVDGTTGDGTLNASTTNDPTLWTAAFGIVTRTLTSAPLAKGSRYALGLLAVGTTMPNFFGNTHIPQLGSGFGVSGSPRLAGQISSLTDLPASFTEASLQVNSSPIYSVLLP